MSQTLAERISDRIQRNGPITFEAWMKAALYDELQGYYCRRDLPRWGRQGDYLTSPESSDLFAATFARYFAHLFSELGSPKMFMVVEMGGGAGHFAAEVLETLQGRFPAVFGRLNYVLDEISNDARIRAAAVPGHRRRESRQARAAASSTHRARMREPSCRRTPA